MIKLDKLNNIILNNNIIYNNKSLTLIREHFVNNSIFLNILNLLKKKILIFLDFYFRCTVPSLLMENFFFKYNKTFSTIAMLS
jgi:hypothetical protein